MASVSAIAGCRMLAIRVAAVLCGALMGWSCASQSGGSIELEPPDSGGGFDLQVNVTPEPGSLGLLGIASLGLLRRRRARRSAAS